MATIERETTTSTRIFADMRLATTINRHSTVKSSVIRIWTEFVSFDPFHGDDSIRLLLESAILC